MVLIGEMRFQFVLSSVQVVGLFCEGSRVAYECMTPPPVTLVGWFCCFTSQVNSYGHCGTVSSPNHTFFLGGLEQAVNQ